MEMRSMPTAALPPIALEAVLKLLAVGKTAGRGDFAKAVASGAGLAPSAAAEKPTLRLDGAAPLPPVVPMPHGRIELPRGVPGRPPRRQQKRFPPYGRPQNEPLYSFGG